MCCLRFWQVPPGHPWAFLLTNSDIRQGWYLESESGHVRVPKLWNKMDARQHFNVQPLYLLTNGYVVSLSCTSVNCFISITIMLYIVLWKEEQHHKNNTPWLQDHNTFRPNNHETISLQSHEYMRAQQTTRTRKYHNNNTTRARFSYEVKTTRTKPQDRAEDHMSKITRP